MGIKKRNKMPSQYEQRKRPQLDKKEQDRRLRRARRTAFNEPLQQRTENLANATNSSWGSVAQSTMMEDKSISKPDPPSKTAAEVEQPRKEKKGRPKSNEWSMLSSQEKTNDKENEPDTLEAGKQKALQMLKEMEEREKGKKKRNEELKRKWAERKRQMMEQEDEEDDDDSDSDATVASNQEIVDSPQDATVEKTKLIKPKPNFTLPQPPPPAVNDESKVNDTLVSTFSPRIESTPKPSFTKASFTPTLEPDKADSTRQTRSLPGGTSATFDVTPRDQTVDVPETEKTKVVKKGKKKSKAPVEAPEEPDADEDDPPAETTKVIQHRARKSTHRKSSNISSNLPAETTKVIVKGKKPRKSIIHSSSDDDHVEPADVDGETTKVIEPRKKKKSKEGEIIVKRGRGRPKKTQATSPPPSSEEDETEEPDEERSSRKRKSDEGLSDAGGDGGPVDNEHFESVNFELTKSSDNDENEPEQDEPVETEVTKRKEKPSSSRKERRQTLDRRGVKIAKKKKTSLKKTDFLMDKQSESELEARKKLYLRNNVILPETDNPNNYRRSKRTRFKASAHPVHRFSKLLTEKDIKEGKFLFNDVRFDKYSFGGIDNIVATRKKNANAMKKITPEKKKSAKNVEHVIKNLNETDINMIIDDLTAEIEFNTKNGTSSFHAFVTNDNVEYVDMATGETVTDLSAMPTTVRNKAILVKTFMHLGSITKGVMHFGINAAKPSANAGTTTIFEVKNGLFKVTMNDQTRIVPEGNHFFVLADTDYAIENMSRSTGILEFTMTREDIADPEETIMMGGNQTKTKDNLDLDDDSLYDAKDESGERRENQAETETSATFDVTPRDQTVDVPETEKTKVVKKGKEKSKAPVATEPDADEAETESESGEIEDQPDDDIEDDSV